LPDLLGGRGVLSFAARGKGEGEEDRRRKIAWAGVNLDLVYVATRNRVVFGATDLPGLRAALEAAR
jgi:hypothetical protein